MQTLWQDLRYGARMLMKNPGFTLVAVITLALGVGANTAIFSVVNAVLLRPLPYPESEQLVRLLAMDTARGAIDIGASMPDYREWRKRNQSFAHLAAFATDNYNISGNEEPERVVGAAVDIDFFPLLGVNPAQGRGFSGEEGVYGKHRVVVLSDVLWRRRFGDGTRLDGQKIRLNGESFAIVGVMPRGFRFPSNDVALWTPLALADNDSLNTRGNYWLSVIGRLKPGVTPAQARSDLVNIHRQLEQEKITSGFSGRVETLSEATVGDRRPRDARRGARTARAPVVDREFADRRVGGDRRIVAGLVGRGRASQTRARFAALRHGECGWTRAGLHAGTGVGRQPALRISPGAAFGWFRPQRSHQGRRQRRLAQPSSAGRVGCGGDRDRFGPVGWRGVDDQQPAPVAARRIGIRDREHLDDAAFAARSQVPE